MTKHNSTQHTTAIQAITFANAENPKMSSLDIAKFTGKRHDRVMRDIEKMFAELNIHAPHFWGTYKTKQGNEYGCFNLRKFRSKGCCYYRHPFFICGIITKPTIRKIVWASININ